MNEPYVHPEHLFTVFDIAGTTYRITEAARLGSLEGPSNTWWFKRDRPGDSTFQVLLDGTSRTVTYRFWKDALATQGARLDYKGTDSSVAQVYY
jgi:hypothetical protein